MGMGGCASVGKYVLHGMLCSIPSCHIIALARVLSSPASIRAEETTPWHGIFALASLSRKSLLNESPLPPSGWSPHPGGEGFLGDASGWGG